MFETQKIKNVIINRSNAVSLFNLIKKKKIDRNRTKYCIETHFEWRVYVFDNYYLKKNWL